MGSSKNVPAMKEGASIMRPDLVDQPGTSGAKIPPTQKGSKLAAGSKGASLLRSQQHDKGGQPS